MYDLEIAECRRKIAMGQSLNALFNYNPDFKVVIKDGFLRDEVLNKSLNINKDKNDTVQFLRAVSTFRSYLDKIEAEAEQAQIDLVNYQQLIQDAH